jgi:primosomal protein N' (replication factor Y) (superfamily II helicase)
VYAEIVVNLPIEGTFHYHIPAEFTDRLRAGHLVEVQFGPQKVQGVVIDLSLRAPVNSTKPVLDLIDHDPVVTVEQLEVARWMSSMYLAPLSQCVQVFIPPGLSKRGDVLVTPVIEADLIESEGDTQERLLKLLAKRGPLRGRQLERALPRRNWQAAVSQLMERGLVLREPVLDPPAVNPKFVGIVELAMPPEKVEEAIGAFLDPEQVAANRRGAVERRAQILRVLAIESEPLDVGLVYASVPGAAIADLRALAEDDLVLLRREEVWRDPLSEMAFVPDQPPQLTHDQAAAWEFIREKLDSEAQPHPILLHGVTGSGKTEVYMHAVEHALAQGRSAVVLVPEIALTPQTIRRFGARFPGRMGLIHSQLSAGERYDTWRRARSGQFDVIVGPRSALFTPLQNLGVIIIDECHDDSYKQSPPVQPPYYHAIPTAIELAKRHNALVIMGSATPNVGMAAQATPPGASKQGAYTYIELPARIMGHRRAIEVQAITHHLQQTKYVHQADEPEEAVMIELPPVQVVDMRQELRAGNRSIFSRALAIALEETLQRGEQVILFLNRRGTATYVFCRACGHVLACPKCTIPMTWHMLSGDRGILVCHHCNTRGLQPEQCPECGSDQIRYFGGGTERVEEEVHRRFPEAGVVRWDRDTTGGKDSHEKLLQRFLSRQANVLIGTQMVAKGLDMPLVTLVGVISADTALYLPDYRSGERTFQLLTQVAGRAGRGLLGGQVILQTYAPEHYAIRAASEHDFRAFYQQEMHYRKEMAYPPFTRLARLLIRAETSEAARLRAEELHRQITTEIRSQRLVNTDLVGPAPAFYPLRDGLHRWHLIVRGPDPSLALRGLTTSASLHIDIDPVSLL